MILTPHVLHISLWLWCLVLDAEYVDIIHCGSWKINFVTNCLIVNTKRTWIVKISVSRVTCSYCILIVLSFSVSLIPFLFFNILSAITFITCKQVNLHLYEKIGIFMCIYTFNFGTFTVLSLFLQYMDAVTRIRYF